MTDRAMSKQQPDFLKYVPDSSSIGGRFVLDLFIQEHPEGHQSHVFEGCYGEFRIELKDWLQASPMARGSMLDARLRMAFEELRDLVLRDPENKIRPKLTYQDHRMGYGCAADKPVVPRSDP